MSGDLGKAYREILSQCCAPIFWHRRKGKVAPILNNGTITFLQTPKRLLGVTAAHVVLEYQEVCANAASPVHLQVMNASLDLELVALSKALDIATVAIDDRTISRVGKPIVPLSIWPPQPPQEGRGIMLAGYPATDRLMLKPMEANWGLFTALSIARRVIGDQITWTPEREQDGVITNLPSNHPLGGASGGPLIGWFESPSYLVHHVLSGIISEAHAGLENVIARRADFIRADGSIAEPLHHRW
jgi:hypothetical protein